MTKELSELQWAHETLMRLIVLIQKNGFLNDNLRATIVQLSNGAVMLEGLIQEQLAYVRRRKDDE